MDGLGGKRKVDFNIAKRYTTENTERTEKDWAKNLLGRVAPQSGSIELFTVEAPGVSVVAAVLVGLGWRSRH